MSSKAEVKQSKIETAKQQGDYLRGRVAPTLHSDAAHFGKDDVHLLKFHGTYQQDDRDLRKARFAEGLGRAYQFMVRLVLPAGILDAQQYLALDEMAGRYGNGSLRITTRQGFQFHGVLKGDLKPLIGDIHQQLLTTLGACGDLERNVMACPAPDGDEGHRVVQRLAGQISRDLRPASRAYHEIWLDGEKVVSAKPEEPFYGKAYLPRKLKTGVALENDNCIDIFCCDIGLIAALEEERVVGYHLIVGGGMGMTHNKPETVARLADPMGFLGPSEDQAVEAVRTLAAIFRDYGNRVDRRQARLKYLLEKWGMERLGEEFRKRTSVPLHPARQLRRIPFHDHLGAHPQGEGRFYYGIYVDMGRIADRPGVRLRSALQEIVSEFLPGVRNTAHQNLLLTDLSREAVEQLEETLRHHGVRPARELPAARRYSMACPALPTCGLALGESERLLPTVLVQLEGELEQLGLREAPLTVRMTGCPNG
ncbi:MAG: NADPH-dependent assimilatory sulfite reductase hemoprotein subunit, partial [Acidobacteriota bacterium]